MMRPMTGSDVCALGQATGQGAGEGKGRKRESGVRYVRRCLRVLGWQIPVGPVLRGWQVNHSCRVDGIEL